MQHSTSPDELRRRVGISSGIRTAVLASLDLFLCKSGSRQDGQAGQETIQQVTMQDLLQIRFTHNLLDDIKRCFAHTPSFGLA